MSEQPVNPPSEDGPTTKDAGDLGVPMLAGQPDEPQGPEDALGDGPKRGDYTDRVGPSHYQPHTGTEAQRPKTDEQGDAPGKGGVSTAS